MEKRGLSELAQPVPSELPIHILAMADSENQYDQEDLLNLVNDPEFPVAPAV